MKAAILTAIGSIPTYTDVPEPVESNADDVMVNVIASSIKQLDLLKASGNHYTKFERLPAVMGMDGIVIHNGQRVYAMGQTGMMAERALVKKNQWVPVPDGLDSASAAALPNALVGSDIALRTKGKIRPGNVVLINGATGGTGMVAVQMAKYHNASAIIATGRNAEALAKLKRIGADITVSLDRPETEIITDFQTAYDRFPFDIILDYLWGRSAELLMKALGTRPSVKKTRFITVGEMTGSTIALPSETLRGRDIVLLGSGIGSFKHDVIADYLRNDLQDVYQYAASGNLTIETETYDLKDITEAWRRNKPAVIGIQKSSR